MSYTQERDALTVYKASAGSGKTFTLATEYIKLLIENPLNYRSILAVTFTNKATEEMKMRIVSQLYGIAHQLPSSESYLRKIETELDGYSRELIAKRAEQALSLLIHNYSFFNVETIDAFFQTVLRNLARELDLTPNLRLELNGKQAEDKAVDDMIDNLTTKDKVFGWIMEYIDGKLEDDKNWNVIKQIKDFGAKIFDDEYKESSREINERLADEEGFKDFVGKMHAIKTNGEKAIKDVCDEVFDALEQNGLTEADFARNIFNYFKKLKDGQYDDKIVNSTIEKALADPINWVRKADQEKGSPALTLARDVLWNKMRAIEDMRPQIARDILSAKLTLNNLSQLRLLNSIEKQIRDNNNESNKFLLSDTQTILHNMIDGSDSPFIFEKIGGRLNNIMIDEFQDTSSVQWQNFKVLLDDCMSRENAYNLIVGDVKQSIYRWRGGDWELLNNIDRQFHGQNLNIKTLGVNYRSERNIIEFNNAFFRKAIDIECADMAEIDEKSEEQMRQAYADVAQMVPETKGSNGSVHIEFMTAEEDYDAEFLAMLKDLITDLLSKGVKEQDIAILARNNDKIQLIADYAAQEMPDVKFVSDEAFRLDASLAVNVLTNALHVLIHPDDLLATAALVKAWQKEIMGNEQGEGSIFLNAENIADLLPQEYNEERNALMEMPLYDLTERLFLIFNLDRLGDQSAYVCAFYDLLSDYITNYGSNIDGFLTAWEENLHNKSIQSDAVNGIRLLTIHKSKGLEFDNVIIPFCDWEMEKPNTIWCKPTVAPYNYLPLVPVMFSQNMLNSVYRDDYIHEHLQNMVDNMNMLYVALTRASKNLFIYGNIDSRHRSNHRGKTIVEALSQMESEFPGCQLSVETSTNKNGGENISMLTFDYGKLYVPEKKAEKKDKSSNVFEQETTPISLNIETFSPSVVFRQSNQSREFVESDEDDNGHSLYIKKGSILHNLFSTIRTYDDMPKALDALESDGVLYDDDISKTKLVEFLKSRLESEQVKDWFSNRWQVLNERSILSTDKETGKVRQHRPDRVMTDGKEMVVVDFKFASPKDEHKQQVSGYIDLLHDMGNDNVKGYLWYVYSNKIVEVK